MNKTLRNGLALVLCAVLALGALPFVSAANGGTQLYHWSAAAVAGKRDEAVFTNLVNNEDAKVHWDETGVMYTAQGKQTVASHTFLNEAAGFGKNTYGLPRTTVGGKTVTENLKVDVYATVNTKEMAALGLSFVYAYKPNGGGNNVANSDLMQVAVSKNAVDWLSGTVGVRSAEIVGVGTSGGEPVIYYQVYSENLLNIAGFNAGDSIYAVRIMPDGEGNSSKGVFSMSELTVTGYKSKADFESAVPVKTSVQGTQKVDEAAGRQALVDAVRNSSADNELDAIVEAISLAAEIKPKTVAELLDTTGIRVMDGIATEAEATVLEIFEYLFDRNFMSTEEADRRIAEYETINSSYDIVMRLNTPQQVFRGYAKAQAGDLMLQVPENGEAHVYMVTKVTPVYLTDRVSLDPNQSTVTYLTQKGEVTENFFTVWTKKNFAPMTLSALTEGKVSAAEVEVFAALADGVNVAVTSDKKITKCEITVGTTTVAVETGRNAVVCSDPKLADAVAALADGKHKLTAVVTSGLTGAQTVVVEFEKKDGKVAVQGSVAPKHDDSCPSKAMTDVDKNAWYHEAVDYALTNGIMGGYNATTFGPNDTLSRAMVVQVLYNKEGKPAISGKHNFADVAADQWYNNAVTWGTQKGVMSGYNPTTFGPDDQVTVEQVAVILWNYSGNPAFSGNADSVGEHSGWAANALAWAVENHILESVPYTNVTAAATRAQTAQMLMNYLTAN